MRDLPPIYEAFFNDEKARTCKKCGAIHPGKKPPPGWVQIPLQGLLGLGAAPGTRGGE